CSPYVFNFDISSLHAVYMLFDKLVTLPSPSDFWDDCVYGRFQGNGFQVQTITENGWRNVISSK
ncbi:uncharacterized protein V6R79_021225, partial [Siganus canaliculatus]